MKTNNLKALIFISIIFSISCSSNTPEGIKSNTNILSTVSPETMPELIPSSNATPSGSCTSFSKYFRENGYINPKWSPDGKNLSYLSDITHSYYCSENQLSDLYLMNLDTGIQKKLTNISLYKAGFIYDDYILDYNWSPNSKKIIIETEFTFYIYNLETSNLIKIKNKDRPNFYSYGSVWSPNGIKILLRDDNYLYLSNSDGGGLTKIFPDILKYNPESASSFSFSEDSQKIFIISNNNEKFLENRGYNFYTFDINNKKLELTSFISEENPSLKEEMVSFNMQNIIYTKENNNSNDLYLYDLLNKKENLISENITNHFYYDFDYYTLAKHLNKVFYTKRTNDSSSIFSSDLDGSNKKEILKSSVYLKSIDLSSDNKKFVFSIKDFDDVQHSSYINIYTINSDGSNLTKINTKKAFEEEDPNILYK